MKAKMSEMRRCLFLEVCHTRFPSTLKYISLKLLMVEEPGLTSRLHTPNFTFTFVTQLVVYNPCPRSVPEKGHFSAHNIQPYLYNMQYEGFSEDLIKPRATFQVQRSLRQGEKKKKRQSGRSKDVSGELSTLPTRRLERGGREVE